MENNNLDNILRNGIHSIIGVSFITEPEIEKVIVDFDNYSIEDLETIYEIRKEYYRKKYSY